jgi:hypothetical protein
MRRFLWIPLMLLSACNESPAPSVFLSFTETEPGGEPYPVRMLITEKYLRIEDGDGKGGFILFDRAARTAYSVNHEARTTLVLKARPVEMARPAKFENQAERDSATYPAVEGRTVTHFRLMTNGEHCFDVYAADGLLPQAVKALREYHEALAGEQATMQAQVPAAFQSACDIADYVFLPTRHLDHGFPVRQINRAGLLRQLADFKTGVPVPPKFLEIPPDYKQLTPADVRAK